MKYLTLLTSVVCLAGAFTVSAQEAGAAREVAAVSDALRADVADLIEAAGTDTLGLQFVEDLTTEVGPRLAGSDGEQRALKWAEAEMKELGFSNVRIEPFEIPFWARQREVAEILSPAPQRLTITALGGSTSTPEGGYTADVVRFENLAELQAASEADVSGKIVFIDEKMTRTQDGSGYGMAVRKRRACAADTVAKGGLACLIRSVGTQARRFPHAGMMARGEALGAGPAAALSPPDADQLTRLLERGPVELRLDLQVETRPGVPSGNVVAEIPGSEAPEEIVLIGCHIDSWDLGTGALDDGAGCGIVVGAAKLIMALDTPPKRTIRVVLYGAEEVGLLGGFAYARQHGDELDNHVLAAESDFGADRVWRFQTRFGEGALPYARAMQDMLAPLGVSPSGNDARGGPDVSMLVPAGVPVVTPTQDGWDYFDYHHTPDDTFDKIDPDNLRQNIATYAVFAWMAAATDWDFRKAAVTAGGEAGTAAD